MNVKSALADFRNKLFLKFKVYMDSINKAKRFCLVVEAYPFLCVCDNYNLGSILVLIETNNLYIKNIVVDKLGYLFLIAI